MAKILLGIAREEKENNEYLDVIGIIPRGHAVTYVDTDLAMSKELFRYNPIDSDVPPEGQKYGLVICHSGLFNPDLKPEPRSFAFERDIINYLRMAGAPVIVLAEGEMADHIRKSVKKAGFYQVDEPFDDGWTMRLIDSLLPRRKPCTLWSTRLFCGGAEPEPFP